VKYTVQTQVEYTIEVEADSPEEAKDKASLIPYEDQGMEFLWNSVLDENGNEIEGD